MAQQTERPQVVQIALAAALGDRQNVIRIPQTAAGGYRLDPVQPQTGNPSRPPRPLQGVIGSHGIDSARRAHAAIPRKHLVPQIPRIGPQTPLVNAIIAAEGSPAPRQNLQITPPAKSQAVWPGR